jgi:thioredoxin-related protein
MTRLFAFIVFVYCFVGRGYSQEGATTTMDSSTSQKGIAFQTGLSWSQIREKARAEHKYIFMDCYATWCGPCKFMSQEIFPQKEVGDYMNAHFISVAVQMDKTGNDKEEVKAWYANAEMLARDYSIEDYPTYLFFSPDGQVVHRVIGATGKEAKDFIGKAAEALDPQRQYYTVVDSYKTHARDTGFLRHALTLAIQSDDDKNAEHIADAYVDCLSAPYSYEQISLIREALQSSRDRSFALFLHHPAMIDSVLQRPNAAEDRVAKIIANEEVVDSFSRADAIVDWGKIVDGIKLKYPAINETMVRVIHETYESEIKHALLKPLLYGEGAPMANWARIAQEIKHKCPGYDPEAIIAKEKPRYFTTKKMWRESDKATLACLNKYGSTMDAYDLNTFLWDYAFMHSTNRGLLLKAVDMSRGTIGDTTGTSKISYGQSEYIDTYANLLYKIGEKDKAIAWEKKALEAAEQHNREDLKFDEVNFKVTLSRMQKGEATWVGRSGPRDQYR